MDVLRAAWSPRWRWLTITVLWVLVAALALWGFAAGAPDISVADRLYYIPDVFGLTFPNDVAGRDWRIQLARFLGPLVFASTFFAATIAVFRTQVERWRMRRRKDHVVVVGLGEKGSRLASSFVDAGRKVTAIESDPTNPFVSGARRRGVIVLDGDATDREVLEQAAVGRAADLVVVCDDATNAEVVAVARKVERSPARPALQASVHLVDPQLSRLLGSRGLGTGTASVRCDFFNVYGRGARVWLTDADPLAADPLGRPPHLVVVGGGPLGEGILVAAAQRWAEAEEEPAPLHITLIDPAASDRLVGMRYRNPALAVHTTVDAIDLDEDRPDVKGVAAFRALLAGGSVTTVFVCHDDDTAALSTALTVRQGLGAVPATVWVRTRSDSGLGLLIDEEATMLSPVGLKGFPFLDRTCSAAAIDGGTAEAVARALHDDYLGRARREGRTGPTVVPWDELDEPTRESNRRAADSVVAALADISCSLSPLYGWDGSGFALRDDEVDVLARREHERWRAERQQAGWTYAPVRDDAAKHHPLLVDWTQLHDADKAFNREAARALPGMLNRAGFEIVRLLTPLPAAEASGPTPVPRPTGGPVGRPTPSPSPSRLGPGRPTARPAPNPAPRPASPPPTEADPTPGRPAPGGPIPYAEPGAGDPDGDPETPHWTHLA